MRMSMLATTQTATTSSNAASTATGALLSDVDVVKSVHYDQERRQLSSDRTGNVIADSSTSNRSSASGASSAHFNSNANDNNYNIISSNNFDNESSAMTYLSSTTTPSNSANGHISQAEMSKTPYFNYPTYPTMLNSLHFPNYDTIAMEHDTESAPTSAVTNSPVSFGVTQNQHSSIPLNLPWYSNQVENNSSVPTQYSSNHDLTMDLEKLEQMFKLHENPISTTNTTVSSRNPDIRATSITESHTSSTPMSASTESPSASLKVIPAHLNVSSRISDLSNFNKGILVTNPNSPEYLFNTPKFDLQKEIQSLVKLAHRNKDIKLSDTQDESKREEFQQKLLKKIKRKRQASHSSKTITGNSQSSKNIDLSSSTVAAKGKIKRTIGRPLTPKTKIRLTLIPNLPTLYSMLVTESIDLAELKSQLTSSSSTSSISSSSSDPRMIKLPSFSRNIREKFKVLKRGNLDESKAYEELLFNESVDWRFKTASVSDTNPFGPASDLFDNGLHSGGSFPGKTQAVTFLDIHHNGEDMGSSDLLSPNKSFPNAIGIEEDNSLIYKSVDAAVREIFGLKEYTFLRITRAAAFEKTGSVVLKMETIKPGYKWLDDDEFDLKLMFRVFGGENLDELDNRSDDYSSQFGSSGDPITTTFLKKKIARPRYKSNMRIYLIPRSTDAILYTRESMLKRDIINGTLDLNDKTDPRMIITAFEFENVLRELNII